MTSLERPYSLGSSSGMGFDGKQRKRGANKYMLICGHTVRVKKGPRVATTLSTMSLILEMFGRLSTPLLFLNWPLSTVAHHLLSV